MKEKHKEDLRILKTRKILKDSLYALLQEMPMEEITVNDICRRGEVHRTTFYKHYPDKYALLNTVIGDGLQTVLPTEAERGHISASEELPDAVLKHLCQILDKNREPLARILSANRGRELRGILFTQISEYFTRCPGWDFKGVPSDVSARFFVGGMIAVIEWWLEYGDGSSSGDIVGYVKKFK